MKLYEITYLMPIDLPEDGTKALQERINTFISEAQGTIDRIEEVTKKRLGEPQRGQNMAQMATVNFYFNPEKLNDLDKKIKTETQIIHYFILNKKTHKAEAPRRIRKMAPVIISETVKPAEKTVLTTKPKKVEIKEIEKKLEEILGE